MRSVSIAPIYQDCKWSQGCEIELQGTGCHETDADHIYR